MRLCGLVKRQKKLRKHQKAKRPAAVSFRVWIYIERANHGTAFNRPSVLGLGICDPSASPGPAELASVWALEDLFLARRHPMAV